MYAYVTEDDLIRVEGKLFPHIIIRDAVEKLSPKEPASHFRIQVQKSLGFDEAHAPSHKVQVAVYNKIADTLNKLGDKATARVFCDALQIEQPNWG